MLSANSAKQKRFKNLNKIKVLYTRCSIKEANRYFHSGSSLNLQISFRLINQCQSKTNKYDPENLILSKYYLYGASHIKNVLKESVLDIKFG